MDRPTLKKKDDREEPTATEKAFMAIAAALTAALLAYMLWQAFALPEDLTPRAEVLETWTSPEGDVMVRVAMLNDASLGIRDVEVEVKCGDQPPAIMFSFVPAHSRRDGVVVCPPDTEQPPEVGVVYWVAA